MKYLMECLIFIGGSDLIFPHHENENIQTIAHSGHELSKYWMHVGRLDFGDEK